MPKKGPNAYNLAGLRHDAVAANANRMGRPCVNALISMRDPRGRIAFEDCLWDSISGEVTVVIDGTYDARATREAELVAERDAAAAVEQAMQQAAWAAQIANFDSIVWGRMPQEVANLKMALDLQNVEQTGAGRGLGQLGLSRGLSTAAVNACLMIEVEENRRRNLAP